MGNFGKEQHDIQNDSRLATGCKSEDVRDYPIVNTLGTHYIAAMA